MLLYLTDSKDGGVDEILRRQLDGLRVEAAARARSEAALREEIRCLKRRYVCVTRLNPRRHASLKVSRWRQRQPTRQLRVVGYVNLIKRFGTVQGTLVDEANVPKTLRAGSLEEGFTPMLSVVATRMRETNR